MRQIFKTISFETSEKIILEITDRVASEVKKSLINNGLLNLSVLHTSCSLLVQENADPLVQLDIKEFLEKIAPEMNYNHSNEGPDDMPAHLKSLLTQTHLSLSIHNKKVILGLWQGIFLLEHRISSRIRNVEVHIIGD